MLFRSPVSPELPLDLGHGSQSPNRRHVALIEVAKVAALFPSQAQMVDAMIRGEIAIAPLVTNLAIPLAVQGAPLKWFFPPEGVPVTVFSAGIAKGAGHPNAAKLFLDWALSREGQALMVELGSFSAMEAGPMPPGVDTKAIKTWYPDDDEIEKIFKSWTDDWNKAYNYRQ